MSEDDRYTVQLLERIEHELTNLAEAGLAVNMPEHKQFYLSAILRYVNRKRHAELKQRGVDFGTPP